MTQISFFSRRNRVRRIRQGGADCVCKIFADFQDWKTELDVYRRAENALYVPKVLGAAPCILLLEFLPLPTLAEELERQERESFSPEPWRALAKWLEAFQTQTHLLPADVNLRNFLWDAEKGKICGIDFESCREGSLSETLAEAAAFLSEYRPADTPVKHRAARLLTDRSLGDARARIRQRRAQVHRPDAAAQCSFLLMAGGKSSRMGTDKAALPFLGQTILDFQSEKIAMLGTDDVLICGRRPDVLGARTVPDLLPDRGPLGGLHAGLSAARHDACLVMSVDVPLVPASVFRKLAAVHADGKSAVTLARHGEKWEPLIGVYDRSLAEKIAPMIQSGGAPVRRLLERVPCRFVDFCLPDDCWLNCNTPEAYDSLLARFRQ